MTDSTPAVSEALRRLKMLARPGDMPDLLAVQAGMDDLTRQLAEAQAELARRTSEVIVVGATALACSPSVKEMWDMQQAALADARRDAESLRGFIYEIMPLDEEWIGDVDGGTLQNAAVKHGLLAEHEVAEPCGDGCNCASYGDFPQTCYRPTDTMKRDAAMGGGTGEG
jgi:hypothetical protein